MIFLPSLVPYKSDKVVPYKYNATILEDGVENIAKPSRVTRSGRVFAPIIRGNVNADKKVVEPKKAVGDSSGTTLEKYGDDIL